MCHHLELLPIDGQMCGLRQLFTSNHSGEDYLKKTWGCKTVVSLVS